MSASSTDAEKDPRSTIDKITDASLISKITTIEVRQGRGGEGTDARVGGRCASMGGRVDR